MVYVVPAVCFLVPLIVCIFLMRHGQRRIVIGLGVILCIGVVWGILRGQGAQGYDAIGFGIFAMLMCAPALIGTLVGGAFGLWKWGRGE